MKICIILCMTVLLTKSCRVELSPSEPQVSSSKPLDKIKAGPLTTIDCLVNGENEPFQTTYLKQPYLRIDFQFNVNLYNVTLFAPKDTEWIHQVKAGTPIHTFEICMNDSFVGIFCHPEPDPVLTNYIHISIVGSRAKSLRILEIKANDEFIRELSAAIPAHTETSPISSSEISSPAALTTTSSPAALPTSSPAALTSAPPITEIVASTCGAVATAAILLLCCCFRRKKNNKVIHSHSEEAAQEWIGKKESKSGDGKKKAEPKMGNVRQNMETDQEVPESFNMRRMVSDDIQMLPDDSSNHAIESTPDNRINADMEDDEETGGIKICGDLCATGDLQVGNIVNDNSTTNNSTTNNTNILNKNFLVINMPGDTSSETMDNVVKVITKSVSQLHLAQVKSLEKLE